MAATAMEVRVFREGALRWVQASGYMASAGGTSGQIVPQWATASGALTGLIGYVQAGAEFSQPKEYATIIDRGIPKHHKFLGLEAGQMTFTVLYGVTADYPPIITASGLSTPQIHLEFRQQFDEWAAGSALYTQLINCVEVSRKFTEEQAGDKMQFTFRYLSSNGPTTAGYMTG